jgi:hypothetical protein
METINLRITLDEDAPYGEYLTDGVIDTVIHLDDGTHQIIVKDVDEVLLESMNPDDLVEFFGIDSEYVIATEVLEFA